MNYHLTVTHHFGNYRPGDLITDPDEIESALKNNPSHVVRVPASAPTVDASSTTV